MTGSITERIAAAEEKWLALVRPFTSKLFSETFIPSHDQAHHQRVWNICKKLLHELESLSSIAGPELVEGLLLAAWFHDIGMARDTGERHGVMGREIFEEFIRKAPSVEPAHYREMLDAIEYHDSKERSAYPDLRPGVAPKILGILSIADDLDALGNVGVYRYSEIYLKRGIPVRLLGIKILSNVNMRFRNIHKSCAALPAIINPYRPEYDIIENFFNLYNQQLLVEAEPETVYRGHVGIINLVRRFSVESEIRPEDFTEQPEISPGGITVNTYFNKLHDELEKADC